MPGSYDLGLVAFHSCDCFTVLLCPVRRGVIGTMERHNISHRLGFAAPWRGFVAPLTRPALFRHVASIGATSAVGRTA